MSLLRKIWSVIAEPLPVDKSPRNECVACDELGELATKRGGAYIAREKLFLSRSARIEIARLHLLTASRLISEAPNAEERSSVLITMSARLVDALGGDL